MDNFDLKKYLAEGKLHEAASTNEKQIVLKDLINVYKPELDELTYDALVRLKEYIEDILISDF
jgi:hypothetical protein